MPLPFGPGPVFVHESIAATRRWQVYALRSLFLLSLLGALGVVWLFVCLEEGMPVGSISVKDLAEGGEYFFYAIATTQLVVVLLVAPATTAGAIGLDRARGNLTHMLATELTNSEIVLGKLAARLLPVAAIVIATIPVLAISGLLGGVIFEAIVSLTVITLALAIFGCALALAISVRATKTHEVLMAVYGIEALWILSPLVFEILAPNGTPDWLVAINPFVLAWAPYAWPNYVSAGWVAGVLAGMLVISAVVVAYAVLRVRAEAARGPAPSVSRLTSRLAEWNRRLFWWRPGPSVDKDPVLWREWRRGRPSRLAMIVWGIFIALSIAGVIDGIVTFADNPRTGSEILMAVNGLYATFGLLLVSLFAPTVLAEERVRGSLDVLLTTPLPTHRIVLAKWWGAYRVMPALAVLPAIGCVIIAAGAPAQPYLVRGSTQQPAPLDMVDRIAYVVIPVGLLLAQGAVVTSVGLALATWFRRVGRAVAVSVTLCTFFAFAWVPAIELGHEVLESLDLWPKHLFGSTEFFMCSVGAGCPFGGQYFTFQRAAWAAGESRLSLYIAQGIVLLATIELALVVLAMAISTFNRCVGRVPERPRRAPRPPRRVSALAGIHAKNLRITQAVRAT
jgi:ABC-type transport system involved in multi-copper enzyme maturation permease subunit